MSENAAELFDGWKAKILQLSNSSGSAPLIDSLVLNEFNVLPDAALVAKELSEKLRKKNSFVDSIVLVGSSVHGGALMRQNLSGKESGDIDWGVIYKGQPPSMDMWSSLVSQSRKLIPEICKKNHMNSKMQSCFFAKPDLYHMPLIQGADHAKTLLDNFIDLPIIQRDIILYFLPSFPETSNETNRSLILKTLKDNSSNDDFWQKATSAIMNRWMEIHKIKQKHVLGTSPTELDKKIAAEVELQSAQIMSEQMRKLLDSTRNN